jgi:hypothetical protein
VEREREREAFIGYKMSKVQRYESWEGGVQNWALECNCNDRGRRDGCITVDNNIYK